LSKSIDGKSLGQELRAHRHLVYGSVTAGPHLCLDNCTQSVNTDDTNIVTRDRRHVPHHLLVPGVPASCIQSVNNSNRALQSSGMWQHAVLPPATPTTTTQVAGSSETSLNFHQTTRRHISKDNNLWFLP